MYPAVTREHIRTCNSIVAGAIAAPHTPCSYIQVIVWVVQCEHGSGACLQYTYYAVLCSTLTTHASAPVNGMAQPYPI
jgi:hypothetical protein